MAESNQLDGQAGRKLAGKRLLITAGPCREPIDPVRYISNRSSGKMGYALARAAVELGAKTTLVSGPTNLIPHEGAEFVSIETTDDLYHAVEERFPECDCLIMAAAPADYTPIEVAEQKVKKRGVSLSLRLKPTVDILKMMGRQKLDDQVLVGFALETENEIENARAKLIEKNLDLIILNNPHHDGAGFDHDTNRVTLIRSEGDPEEWPVQSKQIISHRLLAIIAELF